VPRAYRLSLFVLWMFPLAMCARYWFVCDDAFIAFRFVRNVVDGYGPVFNVGERVEGYTSFLWVMELAAIWAATGLRPEWVAPSLGLVWTVVAGAGLLALAAQSPARPRRVVMLLAVAWWAMNRSVWVWTTSGLEERQFTALFTWAVVLLARGTPAGLAGGSTLVGLAALTRPEAYLMGPIVLAWALWDGWRLGRLDLAAAARICGPAGALVFGHIGWRYSYYGEWLPNTYYAKNVRDWWEAGLSFLAYASIEHALWAVLPLAVWGTVARWRAGDSTHLALWAWAIPSYVHLAKIGGDHFEFRMFDVLWPPLYVAAADGLVAAAGMRRRLIVGATLVAVWGAALPVAHDWLAFPRRGRAKTEKMAVGVNLENTPWLIAVPPVPLLLGPYRELEAFLMAHSVGLRHREHQAFANLVRDRYERYQMVENRDFFQPDAVAGESSIGAYGYYLPGMTLIDLKGLCDWTIARNPVAHKDNDRQLAHDREPPPGYLKARGENIEMEKVHDTLHKALKDGEFAIQLGDRAYAGFLSKDPAYAERAFPAYTLHDRTELAEPWSKSAPKGLEPELTFEHEGATWQVDRWIGRFDEDVDGWALEGRSFSRQPAMGTWLGQGKVSGHEGAGLLNSYHPSWKDWATGTATSPPFRAGPGEALALRVGGGDDADVAVVLLADGVEVTRWGGSRSAALARRVWPLDDLVGKELRLSLRDASTTKWGWIGLDAVSVVRRGAAAPEAKPAVAP
jgi:arabinofuranosyltransferase